jgi:dienelactone hydrolase
LRVPVPSSKDPSKEPNVTDVILFHHVRGVTPGITRFAEALTVAGYPATVPDFYEGKTFESSEAGQAYLDEIGGIRSILDRATLAAEAFLPDVVYAGFSLGVAPAQMLAQTRTGTRGALLYHACLPVSEFSETWPAGVPVQVHGAEDDPFFAHEGDLDAARALVEATPNAELFLYPGSAHLFADDSLPSYDEASAKLLMERTLEFLSRVS